MVTRREALHRFGLGGVGVFVGTIPGLRAIAAPLPVRREITTLALNDPNVQTLRDGVNILKNRGPGQGPSWTDFSNIHGTAAAFNKCPHGNWYFLPWHRAYLLSYERMIRSVTGNNSFAMPYWDWAAHRAVPQAFADPTYNGQTNPLYVATRNNSYSVPDIYSGPSVMTSIYTQTNFELFASSRPTGQNNTNSSWIKASGTQGTLEYTPHNNIHTHLGGYMPNGNSPMDPIFLMHHGNIDRIWWSWNCRGHANTSDPLWLNMPFKNNYYNPDGTWATYKPADLQSVSALGYSYGLCLRRLPWPYLRLVADIRLAQIFRTGRAVGASATGARAFELRSRVSGATMEAVGTAPPRVLINTFSNLKQPDRPVARVAADQRTSQIVALIDNLTPPDDRVEVLVFAGRGELPASSDPKDRYFVTSIGFFGAHAHEHGGMDASVDLTDHLRALPGTGDQILVRLVARPIEGGDERAAQATVAQARVEVVIA